MAFKKGQSGNSLGKPKGATNKTSQEMRECITQIINENLEQVQQDFKNLDAKDRVVLFEKLLKYALPTLQSVASTISFDALSDQQLDEIIQRLKNNSNDQTG